MSGGESAERSHREDLRRLKQRFESQARIFPEDSQSRRSLQWAAEKVEEMIEDGE